MSYILVEQSDLAWATQQGLVSSAQAAALWPALVTRTQGRGGLNLAQVAFYAGSLLIIGALTWFMSVVWESSALLFFLALAYVAAFGAAGVKLWFDGQAEYGIPQVVGGLFVTIAVSVAPIVTFAAQRYLDEWPISRGILIELTLVVGGAVALYGVRFPFLTAPISVGLFLMATFDLARLVWTQPSAVEYGLLSLAFGLAMSSVGFGIDRLKLAQDYGFWLYLFGAFSTYGGLGCLFTTTLLGPSHCAFAIFSTLYIVGGALVNRQSLVVFGSIGVSAYLVWLSSDLFWNSWSYPFVLTAVGLLIIFIGIQVQKYITNKASATTKAAEKNDALSYPYQLLSNAKEAQFAQAHYMPVHMQAPAPAPAQHYFVVPVAQPKTVDV